MNRQELETSDALDWQLGEPSEQQADHFPFLEYLQLLWFRRKLIIAITLFVSVVGWVQVNQIKSIYTASSTLIIGIPQSQVLDVEAVLSRDLYNEGVVGEIEVLRSSGLARKVVQRLGLQNYAEFNPSLREPEEGLFDFLEYLNPRTWIPREWKDAIKEAMGQETRIDEREPPTEEEQAERDVLLAAKIFQGKLNVVEKVEWSNVLTVSFSSLSPDLAARVANAVPEVYILDQLEAKFEATEKANLWLTEQLADLETKVAESERAVEIYREEHGLAESSGKSILDAQLSELNSQLIVARAEKAEIDARLAQIRRLLAAGGPGIGSMTEVLSSSLIQQLRTQELEAMGRLSELSVEFGPKHPRMLQAQAELAEIRERISSEVENVAAGLENEAEFAATRVRSLEQSLREAQGESSELNKEAVRLRALEREAAANRTLFETILNRFKETSSTQTLQSPDARIISEAEVPGAPSYPNRSKQLLTYFLLGLLGACGLVIGLDYLNSGMRSPEQIQRALGEYVIGVIPRLTGKTPIYDYVLQKQHSQVVEAINSLKFSLALSDPDREVKAIQITSSLPSEGKTSLALALARVEAASGKNVLLVDGDLRRSSIGKKLGLSEGSKGLSDLVVAGEADLSEFILRDEAGQMDFLSIGTAEYANAGDIFSSHRMAYLLEQLKQRYDLVVIDAPPVMAVADARIIGRLVDKTLFVVCWDKTPGKVARAALDLLRRAGTDVAGAVLQQVDLNRYGRLGSGNSGYYYHYGHYGKYYSG